MIYLTLREINEKYEIPHTTVQEWIKKGIVTGHKLEGGRGVHGYKLVVLESEIIDAKTNHWRKWNRNRERAGKLPA